MDSVRASAGEALAPSSYEDNTLGACCMGLLGPARADTWGAGLHKKEAHEGKVEAN
jgi:hypothetical protein